MLFSPRFLPSHSPTHPLTQPPNSHDDSHQVVFRALPDTDESKDELMETVTTDESVVKEYNPYREAELMGRCVRCFDGGEDVYVGALP